MSELRRVFLTDAEIEWLKYALAGNVQLADPAVQSLRRKLREGELAETGDIAAVHDLVRAVDAAYENCTTAERKLLLDCWAALGTAADELRAFCDGHIPEGRQPSGDM